MILRLLALWLLLHAGVHAQTFLPPASPQPQFLQHPGAQLPLTEAFSDDRGMPVSLKTYFGSRPVVLVFGYYHCEDLCSTVMDGVLESLADVGLDRGSFRVLAVSIDPTETSDLASRKKESYSALIARAGGDLQMLTGREPQIRGLAQAAGFGYAYDASSHRYIHPAGFLIATPGGRISRYFMGVRFEPRDVRLALVDASSGRVGSPADRLLLLCSHFDPQTGRYGMAAMTLVRAVSLAVLASLAGWIWRQRAISGRMRESGK